MSKFQKEQRIIEGVLVKMLGEHRSWDEYYNIAHALLNVRRSAEGLISENEYLTKNGNTYTDWSCTND